VSKISLRLIKVQNADVKMHLLLDITQNSKNRIALVSYGQTICEPMYIGTFMLISDWNFKVLFGVHTVPNHPRNSQYNAL